MSLTIHYNSGLIPFAKENRKAGIKSEAVVWTFLKNKKLNGLNFDRQRVIGNYIVDFCCVDTGVVIEIDGVSHNDKLEQDAFRDQYMISIGLEVIRIQATDVLTRVQDIIYSLSRHPLLQTPIAERKCFFVPYRNKYSPPTPSQEGKSWKHDKKT